MDVQYFLKDMFGTSMQKKLNRSGENLFMFKDDELITPSETENCLLGITRDCVFEIAEETSIEEINSKFKEAANSYLKGILIG